MPPHPTTSYRESRDWSGPPAPPSNDLKGAAETHTHTTVKSVESNMILKVSYALQSGRADLFKESVIFYILKYYLILNPTPPTCVDLFEGATGPDVVQTV